jgi:hypothetical protein
VSLSGALPTQQTPTQLEKLEGVTRRLAIEVVEQEVAARQFGVFTELQAFHWNVSKDMVSHHSEPGR